MVSVGFTMFLGMMATFFAGVIVGSIVERWIHGD